MDVEEVGIGDVIFIVLIFDLENDDFWLIMFSFFFNFLFFLLNSRLFFIILLRIMDICIK